MNCTEKRVARTPREDQSGCLEMRNVELIEIWNVQNMPEELGPDTRHILGQTSRFIQRGCHTTEVEEEADLVQMKQAVCNLRELNKPEEGSQPRSRP